MNFEIVAVKPRPMLYVTRSVSMNVPEMVRTMSEAFAAVHAFIHDKGISPAGPPLSVYSDWDESTGRMKGDIGFPVTPSDAAKADGEVLAGNTPSGQALKAVHVGPYSHLPDAYSAVMTHMKEKGILPSPVSWEVYANDPATTPPDRLITEIYMKVG